MPDVDDRIGNRLAGGRVDGAQCDDQRCAGLATRDVGAARIGAEVKRAFNGVLQHRALLRAAEVCEGGQAGAALRHRHGRVVAAQGVVPKGLVGDQAIRRAGAFGDCGSDVAGQCQGCGGQRGELQDVAAIRVHEEPFLMKLRIAQRLPDDDPLSSTKGCAVLKRC